MGFLQSPQHLCLSAWLTVRVGMHARDASFVLSGERVRSAGAVHRWQSQPHSIFASTRYIFFCRPLLQLGEVQVGWNLKVELAIQLQVLRLNEKWTACWKLFYEGLRQQMKLLLAIAERSAELHCVVRNSFFPTGWQIWHEFAVSRCYSEEALASTRKALGL